MRYYSNTAIETTLTSGVGATDTTVAVAATTGFPATTPFVLALDADAAAEELVLVTSVGGLTLTVERGYDNTSGASHSTGAVVRHVHSAADFADAREHESATSGVHGVTGDLVGVADVQALTNKDLSSGTNTFPASLATDAELSGHAAATTGVHGVTGAVVGTTDAQALTDKDLTSGTNTFPSSLATDADVNTAVHGGSARTTRPYARIYLSANQTIAAATATTVAFNTTDEETDASFGDPANNRLVAPVAGIYLVELYVNWAGNSTGVRKADILVDGSAVRYVRGFPTTTNELVTSLVAYVRCAAGQAITGRAAHSSGGNLDVIGSAVITDQTSLAACWVAP